jgi:hypothetical protein
MEVQQNLPAEINTIFIKTGLCVETALITCYTSDRQPFILTHFKSDTLTFATSRCCYYFSSNLFSLANLALTGAAGGGGPGLGEVHAKHFSNSALFLIIHTEHSHIFDCDLKSSLRGTFFSCVSSAFLVPANPRACRQLPCLSCEVCGLLVLANTSITLPVARGAADVVAGFTGCFIFRAELLPNVKPLAPDIAAGFGALKVKPVVAEDEAEEPEAEVLLLEPNVVVELEPNVVLEDPEVDVDPDDKDEEEEEANVFDDGAEVVDVVVMLRGELNVNVACKLQKFHNPLCKKDAAFKKITSNFHS